MIFIRSAMKYRCEQRGIVGAVVWEIELCSSADRVAPRPPQWLTGMSANDRLRLVLADAKPTNQIPFHLDFLREAASEIRPIATVLLNGRFLLIDLWCFFLFEWYRLWKSHSALWSIRAVCVCVCFCSQCVFYTSLSCSISSKTVLTENTLVCFISVMVRSVASLPCVCRAESDETR